MTVYAFSHSRFLPTDIALFQTCFDYYRARRGWACWRRQTYSDFDVIVIEDAVEVTHLSLARSADGRYLAFDEDSEEVADAASMRELLPQLGLMLALSPAAGRASSSRSVAC